MKWAGELFQRSAKHLTGFLTPVVTTLGRSERRVAATRYVQGLLLPGQRKSIEPMAERLGGDPQHLQRFVSASPWNDAAVWKVVRQEIIAHLEPLEASGAVRTGRSAGGDRICHQAHAGAPVGWRSAGRRCGDNAEFRAGLRALGAEFFLQVDGARHKGWIWRGRSRN